MDDIVRQALEKWPHVPHCHGWLALDARGDWYMRDERVQSAGAFPQVRGSRVEHPALREFIARNYLADEHGAWFFQNGPQRVYVALEAAPWVWRLRAAGAASAGAVAITSHTGLAAEAESVWLDEHGRLFVATQPGRGQGQGLGLGLGLVHTLDMHLAADAVEAGLWRPVDIAFDELPRRFGYVLQPGPADGPAAAVSSPASPSSTSTR